VPGRVAPSGGVARRGGGRSAISVVATAVAATALALGSVAAAGCQSGQGRPEGARFTVLVFTRTTGFRHESIPAGVRAVKEIGAANGFAVETTEDASAFTPVGLARYQAVVFLNTTGDVLDPAQQSAFESYVRGGNGFVGVHSASDTEYEWPFYGGLVGAYFASHPAVQPATVIVTDRRHPATAHLPETWSRTDEWYNFRSSVRGRVRVLAHLDESSYSGGTMGADHPFAWCQDYSGGRSFYTAGGHTVESYAEPAFRAHLLGGIRYAAGVAPADCAPG
jgi:type 1 glutamine amidotransferase